MNPAAPAPSTRVERLSELLERVVAEEEGVVSLQTIVDRTGGRGGYLLIVFLCLPFTTPVPLPGVSTVFGIVIGWIALGGLRDRQGGLRLPGWLGRRRITVGSHMRVLSGARRFVRWIEKLARPRGGAWMVGMVGRRVHALMLAVLAVLLTLPLPIPFTNSLPAYALIFISVSLMERDGRLVFVGYLLALVALVYVLGWLIGGTGALHAAWGWLFEGGERTP